MISQKFCYQTIIKYLILIGFSIKSLLIQNTSIFDVLCVAIAASLVCFHQYIKAKEALIRKESLNSEILAEIKKDKEQTQAAIQNLSASVTSLRLPDAMRALNSQINRKV